MKRFEELFSEEITRNQKINPQKYYNAKMVSVKFLQELGILDSTIEKSYNIKLKPEDKKK